MMSRSIGRGFAVCALLAALTGCSGSTSSSASGEVEPDPPVGQTPAPPADGETPPGGGDGDDPEQPAEQPVVAFSAGDAVVASGATTTLTWSSEHANSCQASGGWSGSRPVDGSAVVGPLSGSTTFTLSCSGTGGSTMAMLSVSVLGSVSLSWQAPEQNEDGSPVTDLSGYRIYYGSFSRDYDDEVTLNDPAATQWTVDLPSGEYYFAMTAFDGEGNESGYSNEVQRSVN